MTVKSKIKGMLLWVVLSPITARFCQEVFPTYGNAMSMSVFIVDVFAAVLIVGWLFVEGEKRSRADKEGGE